MKSDLFGYVMRWKGQHLANAPQVTLLQVTCGAGEKYVDSAWLKRFAPIGCHQ